MSHSGSTPQAGAWQAGRDPSLVRRLVSAVVPVPGLLLALALVLAACGPAGTGTPSPADASPTADSGATHGAGPSSNASPGATLAVDEGLLRYLPEKVEGLPVEFDPETAQSVAGDPALAANATGLAYGIAANPTGGDLVVAAVVRLRAGIFGEAWFRDWRDTYDASSCAQAGGVAGHAESEIAGRTVYIGTCNGGAHTYHVYLSQDDVVISATSVGPARFGEHLVENLRG